MIGKKKYILLILCFGILLAEDPDSTKSKIFVKKNVLIDAATKFDVNAVHLSAIIFVERSSNYDWSDAALDELIAKRGFNSSVGFCQIKIKTAYWIEQQLNDTLSSFFPGKKYYMQLTVSKSSNELITKILDDTLNISYAAAYLRIIQSYWDKSGYNIDNKPDILGTLYSLGLFRKEGKVRVPHLNPLPNQFGVMTKNSLNLFESFSY